MVLHWVFVDFPLKPDEFQAHRADRDRDLEVKDMSAADDDDSNMSADAIFAAVDSVEEDGSDDDDDDDDEEHEEHDEHHHEHEQQEQQEQERDEQHDNDELQRSPSPVL